MLDSGFGWFVLIWAFILLGSMALGGYFMFRKFFKVLPLKDGKSKLDWQNHYIEQSRHLWTDDSRAFLDTLVEPVPKAFRDIAKHTIGAKIGQIGLESGAAHITIEHCIQGYILATPKRDYRSLKSYLDRLNIDYTPYLHLFQK